MYSLGSDKFMKYSLHGFFCLDGQMRHIETGEPFKFEVKEGDRRYNQKHYEALGEVPTCCFCY